MFSKILLPASLAVVSFLHLVRALPAHVGQSLVERDNNYKLKYRNAPSIVAGNMVNQADVVLSPEFPESGSSDSWLKYLYCTPLTKTYTFFNIGDLSPAPGTGTQTPGYRNVYAAFGQAAATVIELAQNDGDIANGVWTANPPNTNVQIKVQSAKGKLTYGILGAALTGLATASANTNPQNNPMLFQINDGNWGEVGIGVAGYYNNVGQCIAVENSTANYGCDEALQGYFPGFN